MHSLLLEYPQIDRPTVDRPSCGDLEKEEGEKEKGKKEGKPYYHTYIHTVYSTYEVLRISS